MYHYQEKNLKICKPSDELSLLPEGKRVRVLIPLKPPPTPVKQQNIGMCG
jgi:hypothetical protein